MSKIIVQFAYKRVSEDELKGLPVLDCRRLPNPFQHGVSDYELKARVRNSPKFLLMVAEGMDLLAKHDKVYVGCAYGKHRSGAVAEELMSRTPGCQVSLLF